MGINTIGKGLITLFLIGIIYLSLTPMISNLAQDEILFGGEIDPGTAFLKNNVMLIYYASGLIAFLVVIIWMFNASSASGAVSAFN